MKPIGPLMREHRLIERMLSVLAKELTEIHGKGQISPGLIETAVDFFRMYADRTHHGKEEDILFEELSKKELSPENKITLAELIEEHIYARNAVGNLISANEKDLGGNKGSLKDIIACIHELIEFYPKHIEKEDKHFFYPSMEYFSKKEQDDMLHRFWEFDKKLIHEKYQNVVAELEAGHK